MTDQTWTQPITRIEPNEVELRGYRLDHLMGRIPFSSVVFLALTGRLPTDAEGRLLDAVLVASIDHGATPPSALAARTVASTGAPLTTSIAAGIMAINRHHGGAIEGCMMVLMDAVARMKAGAEAAEAAQQVVAAFRVQKQRIPGYGHRVHTDDPRASRLLAIAKAVGTVGEHIAMAESIRTAMRQELGRDLPLNVDGAIAAVLCELGFPSGIGNGLFAIARSAGLTAHVFDEMTAQRSMRRISPTDHAYEGPMGLKLDIQGDR